MPLIGLREGKKVEVTVTEELKKAAKGKERERSDIPPPFIVLTMELLVVVGCGFGNYNGFVMGIWLCFVLSWVWVIEDLVVVAMVVGWQPLFVAVVIVSWLVATAIGLCFVYWLSFVLIY